MVRLLAPEADAVAVADATAVADLQQLLRTDVADAVAKSLQLLQPVRFAARFGFQTLLPKKFL